MGTVSNRPFAIVTGASSGIGLELARQCVQHGFDVMICADSDKIHEAARDLDADGAKILPVRCDLATYDGVEQLVSALDASGRNVDALMLNAGIGVSGEFIANSLEDELRLIGLNVASVVHLAKRVVPRMVQRGKGRVMITSSIAATSPAPYLAVYAASKAFELSFAEALRFELKDSGVTVTALQPGATDTDFFERADMQDTKVAAGSKDDAADVARKGFEAMMDGKDKIIVAGLKSKLEGIAGELLPETVKARMQAMETKPGSAKKS